jgi:hypothetical protein
MLLAALLAIAYLFFHPVTADLAAQAFRSQLFASHGFLIWNNGWYAGHYLPGYSLLFPPLGAALGPRLAGSLAAVTSAGLFASLVGHRYGDRARLATLWFGAGTATMLFTGRLTFALGVAVGLGALLALQRGRPRLAAGLALLTPCASPVAGVFLVLAGVAVVLTGDRRGGAAIVVPAAAAVASLSFAFPTEGHEPFVFTAFLGVPLFAVGALMLLPRDERTLRWGVVIYAIAATVSFAFANPMGGTIARLGALAAGPIAALGLAGRRQVALAVVAVPLLYWQWVAPVRDISRTIGDPAASQSYYQPLLAELKRRTHGEPVRVEIPPTRGRWEAEYVAPEFPLVRGWLRQLESGDFERFTDRRELTPRGYRNWLHRQGVDFVAVPDATPDPLSRREDALIRRGLPYLRPAWSNRHWRLYAVRDASGLVSPRDAPEVPAAPDARLTGLGPDWFKVDVRRAGSYLVRVHFTSYWTVTDGKACVGPKGQWTKLRVKRPGRVQVATRLSLGGIFGRHSECSG